MPILASCVHERRVKAVALGGLQQGGPEGVSHGGEDRGGVALRAAQSGSTAPYAKSFKVGKGSGASVMEIVADFDGNSYRAVYTVRFKNVVYVLHCFQKKSKRGIKTPRHDVELVEARLKWAEADYWQKGGR